MSLANFVPDTVKVPHKKGDFEVRGLTLVDVAFLMREHLDDLEALIPVLTNASISHDMGVSLLIKNGAALIREAPGLVATAIAIACDEPDSVDQARRLSMPMQLNILKAMAKLTFDEAGGPKNFLESLLPFLRQAMPVLPKTDSLT